MSIVADMKPIILQVKEKIKKPSGAIVEAWQDVKTIDLALYLTNDMKYTQSVRYNESTHTGITFYKGLDKHRNRFKDRDTIYTITKLNERGRLTSLLLKVVETDD
ncbi:MAG: phage head-tail adapter protein [Clostridium sp.]|uniref:phage head completion protein n=1 Tax=Clostridium sp. TaxID=1506 RepID=UPI002A88EA1F|nr:phage head-tail adapter protein [Clostridium sp.]MDY5098617.1 phage head-tail adapter protein [Clostridium sp.]